jgi:hypothetical protein
MLTVTIIILLTIPVIFYVGYPLFKRKAKITPISSDSLDGYHLKELLKKKENAYLAIKDLDFDYKMGKLSEADHINLREQLKREAMVILQQIDELEKSQYGESLEDQIEREILAYRKRKKAEIQSYSAKITSEIKCPHCQKPSGANDKFCSECGTRVQMSCEGCGKTYTVGQKFCSHCGTKLVMSD